MASEGEPQEVISTRRTESLDAPGIQELTERWTDELFGRVNIVDIIEKAILAVTLNNDDGDILGHGAFYDYPNLTSIEPGNWEPWLREHYHAEQNTALNTLFMHYFVAKKEYAHGCASEIISTLFNALTEVHYLLLVVPMGVFPDSSLAELFRPMEKIEGKSMKDCEIFVCHRQDHVPVLHIRTARVEDHDDLTPIFNKHSDMLDRTYGNYFLAELIEAQDENTQALIAEVDGTAIGFMSISNEINYDLLNDCFELRPFHGLKKPHEDDDLIPPREPTPSNTPLLESHGRVDSTSSLGSRSSEKISRQASQSGSRKGSGASVRQKLSDAELGGSRSSILQESGSQQSGEGSAPGSQTSSRTVTPRDLHTGPEEVTHQATFGAPVKTQRFVPTYTGEANAFCIQLFCVDEKFEMRSIDFLPKAFEKFPDKDFCIITIPHMCQEFPMLQNFVRATPRVLSTLHQELYIFHRDGLVRNVQVRPAETSDYASVEKLVQTLDLHENFLQDLRKYNNSRRDQDGTSIRAMVADVHGQVVACAIIRNEEDIEYIRSHYNIEDFIYYAHHRRTQHGRLHHFAVNPVFHRYTRLFLKEILRQTNMTSLYYPLFPPYVTPDVVQRHSLVTCLSEMVPVRARRQIQYPLERLEQNAPSQRVVCEREPYALNHVNRKLTMEQKVTINARIVVVGASDVGLAYLETLTFSPHLRFNNLTLISPNGLPGEMAPEKNIQNFLQKSRCYTYEEYGHVALRTWCNVVFGKMTSINREKKHVTVNGQTLVPYDHLVLCTGNQYQIPRPTGADVSQLATNNELPSSPDARFSGISPSNVFTVNNDSEASYALFWVEQNLMNTDGTVVVYGSSIDSYTCVQTLLNMGISGNRIAMVFPPHDSQQATCFNNPDVEAAVTAEVKETGAQIFKGFYMAQWNDGEWTDGDHVSCVSFTSNAKPLRLECEAIFSFYRKAVDYQAFKAVSDACLVYDGRLVIDAEFHTNDASIRAAGPLTKFQRRYHADQWTHACFNSKEVGIQLATTMLSLFDPTIEVEAQDTTHQRLNLIPMYRSPKMVEAVLPGDFHYLNISKPDLRLPLESQMAQAEYGRALITRSKTNGDYFRIHLNQYSSVETITCLSKKPFEVSNLQCLYGLHERCLNNLASRFDEGLIENFYEFMREEWAMAVFHDRFQDFREEIRELLISRPSDDVPALEEKVRAMIEDDLVLKPEDREALRKEFVDTQTRRAVETRLLSFLSYNYYHLPMYAKPGMV